MLSHKALGLCKIQTFLTYFLVSFAGFLSNPRACAVKGDIFNRILVISKLRDL